MTPEKFTFDITRISAQHAIPAAVLQSVELTTYQDMITDSLFVMLRAKIASRDGESLKVPADWWQAVKERWAPRWFLRRWPVDYRTYLARAFYPEIPVARASSVVWQQLPEKPS